VAGSQVALVDHDALIEPDGPAQTVSGCPPTMARLSRLDAGRMNGVGDGM
jgi:hypothetical protein